VSAWFVVTAGSQPSLTNSSVQSALSSTSAAASQAAGFIELHPSSTAADPADIGSSSQYSYYQQSATQQLYPGLFCCICIVSGF